MSREQNIEIANTLLEAMGTRRDPDEIAAFFAEDLVFEIQGDVGVLPWVGRRIGRNVMADFMRDQRAMTEPLAFDVEDVLASDVEDVLASDVEDVLASEERAVIVGRLRTRIKATGKIAATQFALVLTIADDIVTRFQMLEDSYDVSRAARV